MMGSIDRWENDAPLTIFVVAGEPSGDVLGAGLMRALAQLSQRPIKFVGIGGDAMCAEGLQTLFPMAELSVMGLVEVLPHLRRLHQRLEQTVEAVHGARPAAVVTIDSPGFALRLQQRLSGLDIERIHYVAPQVWAWKPWRARSLGRRIDRLLTLLPFEPPYFTQHGLATTFVGHPAVERQPPSSMPTTFRDTYGIPRNAPLLCILPGSRASEVDRLLPVFEATAGQLSAVFPGIHVVVPTIASVAERVDKHLRQWPTPVSMVLDPADKQSAYAAADSALAASGTIAMELAIAGTPTVIAYRMNPVTSFMARRLVRVPHVSLPNLVLSREVQPEYLLDACTPANLTAAVKRFMQDTSARADAIAVGREVADALGAAGTSPSIRAARAVLESLDPER